MTERLQSFVVEHPEFFEIKNGYWRLSSDIRGLMERYARAYNKQEYERMLVLVEEAKIKERERLQSEIDQWTMECLEQQQKAQQIERQLKELDDQLQRSKDRIEDAQSAGKKTPAPKPSWYHSSAVFLILALMGILFFYLGIALSEGVSMSYLMAGLSCFIVGIYFQSGTGKGLNPHEGNDAFRTSVIKEEHGYIKISRLKRAALAERKRVAYQAVAEFNRKINSSNAKLDTLNG